MTAAIRLDDLTNGQRALVLALIRARAAADATKKAAPEVDETGTAKVKEGPTDAVPTT